MEIEKRVSYNVPEGKFRARLQNIEIVRNKEIAACRPNWEILSLESVTTEYRAARSYRSQESDELLDVLEVLGAQDVEIVPVVEGAHVGKG